MVFRAYRQMLYALSNLALAVVLQSLIAGNSAAQTAGVSAPPSVLPGAEFVVEWRGDNAPGDFVALSKTGAPPESFLSYARTSRGNPALLTAPGPGEYEIRYIAAAGLEILAVAPLRVGDAAAALGAPVEVEAGAEVIVSVSGSGEAADYITIVEDGAAAQALGPYARLRGSLQVVVVAPDAAGTYEIRHIRAADQTIIARAALTVRAPTAEASTPVNAPAASPEKTEDAAAPVTPETNAPEPTATASPEPADAPAPRSAVDLLALIAVDYARIFHVAWTGTGRDGDVIGVAPKGGGAEALLDSRTVAGSAPVALTAPEAPGDYDIVYVDGATGAVLARRGIEVW